LIVILTLLLIGSAHADPDFTRLKEGAKAPFDGILLTNEAMTEIITKHERELDQCKIESEYKIKSLTADKKLEYDLLKVRYDAEKEMYLDMIKTRDNQIEKDKKKDTVQRWVTYGAFVLGVSSTVGITYAVNQNFK